MAIKPDIEITAGDAHQRLRAGTLFLIDCRTSPEWDIARVAPSVHIPLDEIEKRHDEVEPAAGQSVAVICHHGVRSVRAALALRALGHPNVMSVAGGIEDWSLTVDRSVPRYTREGGVCKLVPPGTGTA